MLNYHESCSRQKCTRACTCFNIGANIAWTASRSEVETRLSMLSDAKRPSVSVVSWRCRFANKYLNLRTFSRAFDVQVLHGLMSVPRRTRGNNEWSRCCCCFLAVKTVTLCVHSSHLGDATQKYVLPENQYGVLGEYCIFSRMQQTYNSHNARCFVVCPIAFSLSIYLSLSIYFTLSNAYVYAPSHILFSLLQIQRNVKYLSKDYFIGAECFRVRNFNF